MKQLESNKQKGLEGLLKLMEYSVHIPDRKAKEKEFISYLNKYHKKGYDTTTIEHAYAEHIVRVNKRQKELVNQLETKINKMDNIRTISKYMTVLNQRIDLTKSDKDYLLDKSMERIETLKEK